MNCNNTEYDITMETCARYYSAYLEMYETNPTEMCQYLPGTPPLPDVPIPGNFNVYITEDDHPEIVWTHYYVHEYRIERKIGSGSWSNIVTIYDEEEQTYIDEAISLPDPKGRTIYYRMRGKVYDTYSDYTDEKIPLDIEERMLPKKLADDNTTTGPLPQNFELLANYPNPFNSTTAIRFQLPYETHVTLKVFNIHGETIRTLANGTMKPGMQQVEWDGTDHAGRKVASGVYIYQIIAGEFKQALKTTLAY
ncbi:MAG: T9SS type A sorting domain-containing protein [candidate division KSB1 bacterium]|nr:T9SS type A sorting domain-containing protein [candidate division KSB1 bacterium]MDZ7341069.1 T9SS type A sorting domain-containing protein [candidate division KSB1 bacterium]